MKNIRSFIQDHLLGPLKEYPTVIQDTMIEIITQRLEEVYNYSVKFPEIISPNRNRLDILQAIADQFTFSIRDEADLQEQIDILENILYVYNRRGSVDTIENMWKYYGGDLPKDVQVIIPSYNLFRYSISALSESDQFIKHKSKNGDSGKRDLTVNSPGAYEVRLINSNYSIPRLREFMLKELVAAGTEIYFTNALNLGVSQSDESSNPYNYKVLEDTFMDLQLTVTLSDTRGLVLSGQSYNALSYKEEGSYWSGDNPILIELMKIYELGLSESTKYIMDPGDHIDVLTFTASEDVRYVTQVHRNSQLYKYLYSYCTPEDSALYIEDHLYNRNGEEVYTRYPGYFVLNKTPLGTKYYLWEEVV